jgi:acetyl-CoA carboxylase biotin carboxyl carrier protein
MGDRKQPEDEGGAGRTNSGRVDVEAIRQLLELMSQHDLAELEIEQEDLAVRLRKAGAAAAPAAVPPAPAQPAAPAVPESGAGAPAEDLPTIKSPMVGTFYTASGPDAEAFVEVGDQVTEESVVCVIEAMKVFNEIRAEMSGTIEKIFVRNAQAVEFGQPLFAVRPD